MPQKSFTVRAPFQASRRHGHAQLVSMLTLALVALLLLTGCGSSSAGSGSRPPAAEASTTAAGGGGETTTGEAATSTYTNARFKYRVDTPGAMIEAADGSAYLGPAERLEVKIVNGTSAADPHRLAAGDLSLLASKPSFKVMDSLSRVSLTSRSMEKVVFTWTDGVSAVTGKPNDLVSARYYIARDRSTLAIVTYSIAANQYDPQGADDVASTFNWF